LVAHLHFSKRTKPNKKMQNSHQAKAQCHRNRQPINENERRNIALRGFPKDGDSPHQTFVVKIPTFPNAPQSPPLIFFSLIQPKTLS